MMKILIIGGCAAISVFAFSSPHAYSEGQEAEFSVHPKNGMVPNAATAKAIAEAVWGPIYGQKNIDSKKPFEATLKGNIWYVNGTLPLSWTDGVPYAEISKTDGRILRIYHDK